MKPKKKTPVTHKKIEKKQLLAKPLLVVDKTTATTKQRTNVTIEDHFQIAEFRHSIRTNKNLTPRYNCQQKLKDKDMSPFSSSGGSSMSPKYRKIISPKCCNGPPKAKSNLLLDKPCEKIKVEREKKQKIARQQFNQANYQNLLLRKMNEKKITEMSDQSSSSIPKISRLKLTLPTHQIKPSKPSINRGKISQLKRTIRNKYEKQFPGLKKNELLVLCSVVLIQRFWKQNRIKSLINQFFQTKSINEKTQSESAKSIERGKPKQISPQQTLQILKKYRCNISDRVTNILNRQFNLQNLDQSSLSSQKQIKMVKLVQCLKDISFYKPKQPQKKFKVNIFTLRQSLSENCLMQKFYSKIFKKDQTCFESLSLKKDTKNLQRSIELIKTMNTPEKIEIQERFETQLHDNEVIQQRKVSVSVQTDPFYLQKKSKNQLNTLQQLSLVSQSIIFALLNEFSQQFHGFTSKSILRKKKKVRMPGLKVNSSNIREYLQGLSSYMLSQYGSQIIRRWRLIKPINFLKLHHQYQEDQYQDEDQQSDVPVIPNNIFYQYQIVYEENIFKIAEQEKKYCNFLQGLIKIHNILLANCMSQILQKMRMDRVALPWDLMIPSKKLYDKQCLKDDLKAVTNIVCQYSSKRIGQFHKRLDDPAEEKKVLRSIRQEYKNEGSDWSAQYEYLQSRLQLAKSIEEILYIQVLNDLALFF